MGGKPGSGVYTIGGLVTDKLDTLGYSVLQVSDRDCRRPVIGCELCSNHDYLEPCINHLGATMATSLYDTIQQAAIDVVKDSRFCHPLSVGIVLVHGRHVMSDDVIREAYLLSF